MGSYIEQMSGQIALAKIGIKSRQDYTKILKKLKTVMKFQKLQKNIAQN